jgi:hypothetical protein
MYLELLLYVELLRFLRFTVFKNYNTYILFDGASNISDYILTNEVQ